MQDFLLSNIYIYTHIIYIYIRIYIYHCTIFIYSFIYLMYMYIYIYNLYQIYVIHGSCIIYAIILVIPPIASLSRHESFVRDLKHIDICSDSETPMEQQFITFSYFYICLYIKYILLMSIFVCCFLFGHVNPADPFSTSFFTGDGGSTTNQMSNVQLNQGNWLLRGLHIDRSKER